MEEQKNKELEIRFQDLLEVFLHCWWILLLVAVLVFTTLSIYMNATHEDKYTATATVYVMKETDKASTADVSIANTLINDYMELLSMERVLEEVRFELGLNISIRELSEMIRVQKSENTRFVYVSVTASKPQDAADISNALASVACEYMNQVLLNNEPYSKVANESPVPTKPSNPVSTLKLMLFGVIAAILVYAVYLVLFLLDDKINGPEDVEKYLELSILGQIPNKHDTGRRKKYYSNESVNQ